MKIEHKDLLSLFLRKIKKEDFPKRVREDFKLAKEKMMKKEAQLEKLQYQQEEIEGPIYSALLKMYEIKPEDYINMLKQSSKATKQFKFLDSSQSGTPPPPPSGTASGTATAPAIALGTELESIGTVADSSITFKNCEYINVRVCKEKICIEQPLPMNVDDIWLDSGSDGTFNKIGDDGFSAHDAANGTSSWNLTYHRHSQIHSGVIGIMFSGELVESAKVRGLGVNFEQLTFPDGDSYQNGGCASGKTHITKPNSYGHVKLYIKVKIRYKKPGESWVNWIESFKVNYMNHWNDQDRLVPGVCGSFGLNNVIGNSGSSKFNLSSSAIFPAETQFLGDVELEWWVKGNGEGGGAGAHYGLRVFPYITVEACSLVYPETLEIHIPDYIP